MHQREKLEAVRRASVAVLLAPAGGGKTFVAVQRVVQVLNEDPDATVLFVARNEALALFVCKWLVSRRASLPSMLWSACTCSWRRLSAGRGLCASKGEADGGSCLGIRVSTPRRTR